VTAAAAAWGQGDFSPVIHDRSADELGEMGRRLNGMAARLQETMRVRQQLSAAEERNRIARDLHDSVKQQVFAASMNLAAARALWESDPAAARARIDAAADLTRQSQQEMTGIIRTLRPVQLEGRGLCGALTEYVERWREQSGIAATFEGQCAAELPFPVEEALFRIAQEALSNITRHSGATEVSVSLTDADGHATLLIRDNGSGFDARRPPRGVGLQSMRERMETVGGDLRLDSGAGGTTVAACVPVAGGRQA
jgi:NarL family two-component system sensor histidine kinase LiaS